MRARRDCKLKHRSTPSRNNRSPARQNHPQRVRRRTPAGGIPPGATRRRARLQPRAPPRLISISQPVARAFLHIYHTCMVHAPSGTVKRSGVRDPSTRRSVAHTPGLALAGRGRTAAGDHDTGEAEAPGRACMRGWVGGFGGTMKREEWMTSKS